METAKHLQTFFPSVLPGAHKFERCGRAWSQRTGDDGRIEGHLNNSLLTEHVRGL